MHATAANRSNMAAVFIIRIGPITLRVLAEPLIFLFFVSFIGHQNIYFVHVSISQICLLSISPVSTIDWLEAKHAMGQQTMVDSKILLLPPFWDLLPISLYYSAVAAVGMLPEEIMRHMCGLQREEENKTQGEGTRISLPLLAPLHVEFGCSLEGDFGASHLFFFLLFLFVFWKGEWMGDVVHWIRFICFVGDSSGTCRLFESPTGGDLRILPWTYLVDLIGKSIHYCQHDPNKSQVHSFNKKRTPQYRCLLSLFKSSAEQKELSLSLSLANETKAFPFFKIQNSGSHWKNGIQKSEQQTTGCASLTSIVQYSTLYAKELEP